MWLRVWIPERLRNYGLPKSPFIKNGMTKRRYFIEIAYDGTQYAGWQSQPQDTTIQDILEQKMSTQWREDIQVVGCGRTDAGVHAIGYFAHFDTSKELNDDHLHKLNSYLPEDIVVHRIVQVKSDAHARYDAEYRRYKYYLHFKKSIFNRKYSLYVPDKKSYRMDKFHEVAELIKKYHEFKPFCKSGAQVHHYQCDIKDLSWQFNLINDTGVLTITSNRFLHGMIRFIVGCTLNIAADRMTIQDLTHSLENQVPLSMPYKAPAHGLMLDFISYPYICSSRDYVTIFPAYANG